MHWFVHPSPQPGITLSLGACVQTQNPVIVFWPNKFVFNQT